MGTEDPCPARDRRIRGSRIRATMGPALRSLHGGGTVIVCIPVDPSGSVDPRWGRAARVAVADVHDGRVGSWEEFDVGWDRLHDATGEGSHHARVARFLRAHGVELVLAHHMGEPMRDMLEQMGIGVVLGASGNAGLAAAAHATGIVPGAPN